MSLAGSIGKTFLIPSRGQVAPNQAAYAQALDPTTGLKGPDMGYEPHTEDLLLEKEGAVRSYYDGYNQLKSFMDTMYRTYGIDVTAPDARNPLSVEANQIYLKGLADVQNKGNMLRGAYKTREEVNKKVLSGDWDYITPEAQFSGAYTPIEQIGYSTKIDPMVEEWNKRAGKEFQSRASRDEFNAQGDALKQQLQLVLDDPNSSTNEKMKAWRSIGLIGRGYYYNDKEFEKYMGDKERAQWSSIRLQEISSIFDGNFGAIDEIENVEKGSSQWLNGDPRTETITYRKINSDGSRTTHYIDLNDKDNAFSAINGLLNERIYGEQKQRISKVDIDQMERFIEIYKPEWGGNFTLREGDKRSRERLWEYARALNGQTEYTPNIKKKLNDLFATNFEAARAKVGGELEIDKGTKQQTSPITQIVVPAGVQDVDGGTIQNELQVMEASMDNNGITLVGTPTYLIDEKGDKEIATVTVKIPFSREADMVKFMNANSRWFLPESEGNAFAQPDPLNIYSQPNEGDAGMLGEWYKTTDGKQINASQIKSLAFTPTAGGTGIALDDRNGATPEGRAFWREIGRLSPEEMNSVVAGLMEIQANRDQAWNQ